MGIGEAVRTGKNGNIRVNRKHMDQPEHLVQLGTSANGASRKAEGSTRLSRKHTVQPEQSAHQSPEKCISWKARYKIEEVEKKRKQRKQEK